MSKKDIESSSKPARHFLLEQYRQRIPEDLRALLIPSDRRKYSRFTTAIKRLRGREAERDYVRALQAQFELPIRPNATVKETMIQARLKILRQMGRRGASVHASDHHGRLPVDPLE